MKWLTLGNKISGWLAGCLRAQASTKPTPLRVRYWPKQTFVSATHFRSEESFTSFFFSFPLGQCSRIKLTTQSSIMQLVLHRLLATVGHGCQPLPYRPQLAQSGGPSQHLSKSRKTDPRVNFCAGKVAYARSESLAAFLAQ